MSARDFPAAGGSDLATSGSGGGLVDQMRSALEGLNPLTGHGEYSVWQPANRAWEALRKGADRIEELESVSADLLKACRELLEIASIEPRDLGFGEFEAIQADARRVGRAAIAEATGGA